MASAQSQAQPKGLVIENRDVTLTAHAALVKGQCVAIDNATVEWVGTGYAFTTTAAPAAGGAIGAHTTEMVSSGIFAVALDDIASGDDGLFRVQGAVEVLSNQASLAVGDAVTPTAGDTGVVETVADSKVVGFCLTAGDDDDLVTVMFDGLNAFGFSES